jgi:cysteine desulfurase
MSDMGEQKPIYLDNHATTRCDPRVVNAMLPYFSEDYGNSASTVHRMGRFADSAIQDARGQIADLIHCHSKEIIFTSGATESNNLAILGIARGRKSPRKKIIVSAIEHKSVLNAAFALQEEGFDLIRLPVDSDGSVTEQAARDFIDEDTLLVSVQMANNEIGTIQDIQWLAEIAHENGAFFHCDGAQAAGKIDINIDNLNVDLLSISAHKMYGPKGIGVLFTRGGPYAKPLIPIVRGGGQEYGLRSGTHNVPAIVGMGLAAKIAKEEMLDEASRLHKMRDEFETKVIELTDASRNGAQVKRLPGNSNLTIANVDADALIATTPGVIFSTGSACNTGAPEPSYVLEAIGLSRLQAYNTVRFCFGRFNQLDESTIAAEIISKRAIEIARDAMG